MGKNAGITAEIRTIIDAALRGDVTEAMARRAWTLGPEAVLAFMLAARDRIAQLTIAAGSGAGVSPPVGPRSTSKETESTANSLIESCGRHFGNVRARAAESRASVTVAPARSA